MDPVKVPMPPPLPAAVSSRTDHPAYCSYWSRFAQVFRDGERLDRVITVDTTEGWADVAVHPMRWDEEGRIVTERVPGAYELRPMEDRP